MSGPNAAGTGAQVEDAWVKYHERERSAGAQIDPDKVQLQLYQVLMIKEVRKEIRSRLGTREAIKLWSAGSGIDLIGLRLKREFGEKLVLTVFDISPDCIERNKEMFGSKGLEAEFVVGDLFQSKYAETFDIVMNTGLLEHFTEQEMELLLDKFEKSLVKGGAYITVTPYIGAKLANFSRTRAIAKKSWPYGPENPILSLKKFSNERFELVEEYPAAATSQLVMLKHAFPAAKPVFSRLAMLAEGMSPLVEPILIRTIDGYCLFDKFVRR